jgi:hypothetical protein
VSVLPQLDSSSGPSDIMIDGHSLYLMTIQFRYLLLHITEHPFSLDQILRIADVQASNGDQIIGPEVFLLIGLADSLDLVGEFVDSLVELVLLALLEVELGQVDVGDDPHTVRDGGH